MIDPAEDDVTIQPAVAQPPGDAVQPPGDAVQPPGDGPVQPPDAAATYRHETDLRRLRAELERQDEAMRRLTARLRDAEREAATVSGAVVEAVGAELAGWQQRALAAEAELAAVRATKVYRAASPFMAVYRVRRRLPELGRKVVARLG